MSEEQLERFKHVGPITLTIKLAQTPAHEYINEPEISGVGVFS